MFTTVSLGQYFNDKISNEEITAKIEWNAEILLGRVNILLKAFETTTGYKVEINPKTSNNISGNLHGDGGFRLQHSSTGSKSSSHKEGRGIDIYDNSGRLDAWITDEILQEHSLYREHPSATLHWCHLTTRAPASQNRTFYP